MSHFHGGMVDGHTIQDPHDEPPRVRPFTLLAAVLVLVLIGGAVVYGGLLLVRTYTLRADNPYPDSWDPKVVRYVEFVERKRGLDFHHPVRVDFLDRQEFNKALRTDASVLDDEEEIDPEAVTGMLRAVGLLEGKVDLEASTRAYQKAGVLAFYSPRDERIRIRGTKLTPAVTSTLVHELTHALQDQHFDLGGRLELFDRVDEPAAQAAFHAVVEGDASRVQRVWEANLRPKQRAALDRSQAAQLRTYKSRTKALPPIIETVSGAPYALGEALVALVFRKEGQHAVDRLFASPPRTDEQLLSPWIFVDEAQPAIPMRKPKLRTREKAFDDGTFGATTWLLMLAERVPTLRALDAVDGWGGDSYVAFTRRGETCVRVNYRGDNPRDTAEMTGALRAWDAALPGGPASVRVDGKTVVFESCDPGTKASVGRNASMDTLRLVVTRTGLATGLISDGLDFASCASNRLIHRFTVRQLSAPKLSPAVRAAVARTVAPCR